MVNKLNKQVGFGLVEVIISIAVIAVMLIGIHGIVLKAMKNNKDAQIQQQAAMYGQQIFEDFKSSKVTKTITSTGLKLSNMTDELTGDATNGYEKEMDLGNNLYKADIKVNPNSSGIGTALNKEINLSSSTNANNFNVALERVGSVITIKDSETNNQKTITTSFDASDALTLLVYSKDEVNSQKIIIKDKDGNVLLSKDKQAPINLIIDFQDYQKDSSSTADTDLVIKVSNEDDECLNIICENKSENLYASLEQYGSGKFNFYDEKTSKDLYDITVTITRDGNEVFKGSNSQNVEIDK